MVAFWRQCFPNLVVSYTFYLELCAVITALVFVILSQLCSAAGILSKLGPRGKSKPVDYVKYEEKDREGLQKKLINPEKSLLTYLFSLKAS